jgi:cytochrome b involved in lipid metabolism
MKKYLLIGAALLAVIIAGYFLYRGQGTPNNSNKTSDTSQNQGENEPAAKPTYTIAQIAAHATSSDCWLAIEDKVYDITKQISGGTHPGGAANLQGCGKDATTLFNSRPMGSGTPHSEQARSYLPNFYIGDLVKQ